MIPGTNSNLQKLLAGAFDDVDYRFEKAKFTDDALIIAACAGVLVQYTGKGAATSEGDARQLVLSDGGQIGSFSQFLQYCKANPMAGKEFPIMHLGVVVIGDSEYLTQVKFFGERRKLTFTLRGKSFGGAYRFFRI